MAFCHKMWCFFVISNLLLCYKRLSIFPTLLFALCPALVGKVCNHCLWGKSGNKPHKFIKATRYMLGFVF